MTLDVFFARKRKQLEGDALPFGTLDSCCVICLERADRTVGLIGWENRENDEIEAGVTNLEEGPTHFPGLALAHYFVNY